MAVLALACNSTPAREAGSADSGPTRAEAGSSGWGGTYDGSICGDVSSSFDIEVACKNGVLTGQGDDSGGMSTISGTCTATTATFTKRYASGPSATTYNGTLGGDPLGSTFGGTWSGAAGSGGFALGIRSAIAGSPMPVCTAGGAGDGGRADGGGGDFDAGGPASCPADASTPAVCSADGGWCWWNATPQLNDLYAVWGSSSEDVWMVGGAGTILHWNGSAISGVTNDLTSGALFSVWGTSAADVWAVGAGGTILHFDGSAWSVATSGTTNDLHGVWASSPTQAWAVGLAGALLGWDGTSWTPVVDNPLGSGDSGANLYGVWGEGSNNVWAVGDIAGTNGVTTLSLHWSGAEWSEDNTGSISLGTLYGVCQSNQYPGPIAVGTNGGNGIVLESYGMGEWSAPTPVGGGALYGCVDGQPFGDFNSGDQIVTPTAQTFLYGAWQSPSTCDGGPCAQETWAVGLGGALYHAIGGTWTYLLQSSPTFGGGESASPRVAVWGSGANDVWLSAVTTTPLMVECAFAHWDGCVWSDVPCNLSATEQEALNGDLGSEIGPIWGTGPNDVYALGFGAPQHWDGSSWSPVDAQCDNATGVWGSAPDDVWLVGCGNQVGLNNAAGGSHWNGSTWTAEVLTTVGAANFGAVWGSSAKDIWAVGDGMLSNYLILHYDGTSWSPSSPPAFSGVGTPRLTGMWGSSANDVWAFGTGGPLHWDGQGWSVVPVPSVDGGFSPYPTMGWGSGPDDVWALGASVLLHWNGQAWSTADIGLEVGQTHAPGNIGETYTPQSVWTSSGGSVWLAGTRSAPQTSPTVGDNAEPFVLMKAP